MIVRTGRVTRSTSAQVLRRGTTILSAGSRMATEVLKLAVAR